MTASPLRLTVVLTFFLTVNTGLAALLGGQELRWYVAAFRLFSDKWNHLKGARAPWSLWSPRALWACLKPYHDLGMVERIVPLVFAAIYAAELIGQVAGELVDELVAAIRGLIPPDFLPEGDLTVLFRIYAVLAVSKGDRVALEDVHDAWAAWMSEQDAEHPSLRPFRELPAEVQLADEPYVDAIRAVARARHLGR